MNKPKKVRNTTPIEIEAPLNPREIWAMNEDKKQREKLIKENIRSMNRVRKLNWDKTLFSVRLYYEEGILCPERKPVASNGRKSVVSVPKG